MQIPSGYLSDRFGPRITIAAGMFPVAIVTALCPFLARGSPYLLLVGRVIIGFGEVSFLSSPTLSSDSSSAVVFWMSLVNDLIKLRPCLYLEHLLYKRNLTADDICRRDFRIIFSGSK